MFWHKKTLDLDAEPLERVLSIGTKDVFSCNENQTISSAAELLLEGYRKLPVVSDSGKLAGMLAISDVLSYLGAGEKHRLFRRLNAPVRHIMSAPVFIGKSTSIEKCIKLFQRHGRGSYPIVDNRKLCGIVSEWDIVKNISGKTRLSVGDVMVPKPVRISRDATVYDAAKTMVRCFRRLPVVNSKKIVGILTPSDILLHLHRDGFENSLIKNTVRVGDIMEKRVVYARPQTLVSRLLAAMKNRGIGGFPVRENGRLVGIVTERDLIEHL